eukprot:3080420-Prorocentrum_lima.AAC.1
MPLRSPSLDHAACCNPVLNTEYTDLYAPCVSGVPACALPVEGSCSLKDAMPNPQAKAALAKEWDRLRSI